MGPTGDPRGREGTGGGRGAGSLGTGRESGPSRTGPLPALGLLLRLDACPPPCLLPAPAHFPATSGVYSGAWGASDSPITRPLREQPWEAAGSSRPASPSHVPLAQDQRAGVFFLVQGHAAL